MAPGDSGFYLTEAEQLLIQAATAPPGEATAAWQTWCNRIDLDEIAPASFAILPAVAANLDRISDTHPQASRMRGVRRYAWTQTQLTLRDLAEVHRALEEAGVSPLAHQGLPMAQHYLGDLAAIACDQVDLLIAPGDLDTAAETLAGIGWRPVMPVPPTRIRPALQALAFGAPGRRRVVLHWRCFPPGCPQHIEQGVVDRGLPVMVGAMQVAVPEPVDAILIAAARSTALREVERVRWALEALMILRAAPDPDLLRDRAALTGVTSEELRRVIALERPESGVPSSRAGSPTAKPSTPGDLAPSNLGRRLMNAMQATRSRYSAACRAVGRTPTPWGFLAFAADFYRHEWQLPPESGVPAAAIQRLLRSPAETPVA